MTFDPLPQGNSLSFFRLGPLRTWHLQRKIMLAIIPTVVLLLVISGYLVNLVAVRYINAALERTVKIQVLHMAHLMELTLNRTKEDLLALSREPLDGASLHRFLQSKRDFGGVRYRELVFSPEGGGEDFGYADNDAEIVALNAPALENARPVLAGVVEKAREMEPGAVTLSDFMSITYPRISGREVFAPNTVVLRMAAPVYGPDGKRRGVLVLSLDARKLRDVLSLITSPASPLFAFPRTSERRLAYFFDERGWILFQSENMESADKALTTDNARVGFEGDHGKFGLDQAFRPFPEHSVYWEAAAAVQKGERGLFNVDARYEPTLDLTDQTFMGFAPVRFTERPGGPARILGGVVFADRSRLIINAEIRQFNTVSAIVIVSMLLVAAVIYVFARGIMLPVRRLAAAVDEALEKSELHEIQMPDTDRETTALRLAVNRLIMSVRTQHNELRLKDEFLKSVRQREKVALDYDVRGDDDHERFVDILGLSPAMKALKTQIVKAAAVDADVLIIGETGTGKELTANAIHHQSMRRTGPFVSINCGSLDENLLMDSLFGHVKGAFTEAKTDRKGAFLAADGGTLFLDEIGTASPKVQLALLRALSSRVIQPLGCDLEIPFNTRIIAATNADLEGAVREGSFREDLLYRLKVITINTPALRNRPIDIPLLANYFLNEAAAAMNKPGTGLSRGALEKLKAHSWPGNVRELKNCITRAVAMTEDQVLQAEELAFEVQPSDQPLAQLRDFRPVPGPVAAPPPPPTAPGLNPRQAKALPRIRELGGISRADYEELAGGVASRTAQADLQDLVAKGLLRKEGKGPATRYRPA
ncbi:sigma 54-interacting transcriptional regulator [Desulfovibrio aminophilus]|nr:sigma 54-interacting transcriptional regulator [Desulfovibrio aminophilus]MCM0755411.1 sigma 54-interacting transcriptional regulator [Desulfovibrio aminophilus]